jgi:hypothetical protein
MRRAVQVMSVHDLNGWRRRTGRFFCAFAVPRLRQRQHPQQLIPIAFSQEHLHDCLGYPR